jgi:hypothetical protein
MTDQTPQLATARRRQGARRFGYVAATGLLGAIALAPAAQGATSAAHSRTTGATNCAHDHHLYAAAKSAKRVGTSVEVKAYLGTRTCGLDEGNFTYGKTLKTVTVPKGAIVKALTNVRKTSVPSRIPVSKLPHYVNRSLANSDGDIFQLTGPHSHVKKIEQIFIS